MKHTRQKHDPLCPSKVLSVSYECRMCPVIEEVRRDEQQRIWDNLTALESTALESKLDEYYERGYNNGLTDGHSMAMMYISELAASKAYLAPPLD